MISRRQFTKYGLGAAAVAAGAKLISNSQKDAKAFSAISPQKEWGGSRRVGIRPNGTYWGGGSEQIDVLSRNLNYTLPLFAAGGRGINVQIQGFYNSQIWERDNPTVIAYGIDTGFGYGRHIQLGSIVRQYSNGNIIGYTFINDTGAEFPFSLFRGVWISTQGLYISFDQTKRKLQFSDGTFWVMGCESAYGEADSGTLYPTIIEDRNGNQILIRYMPGIGSQQSDTSSRIHEIQDSRAVDTESSRKTYSFTYNEDSIPHLISITSPIDQKANYHFTYEIQQVTSPFGENGNREYDFIRVLKTVHQEGLLPQTFTYNQFGELEQVQLPYGARFRWEYETMNEQGNVRVVSHRGLTLSHGREEAIWEIRSARNMGNNARQITTLIEPVGGSKRIWSFDADLQSNGCGLLSILEEKDERRTLRHTVYQWKCTVAGVPYIGTIVTTLDPGAPEESTFKEDFERDIFGNLTENQKYDFGNPFQPIRVIHNTYSTEPQYIERGICDLLLTSTIGDGNESAEQIRNQYDTTPLVDLQGITEHDTKYGTKQTIRGNLTESIVNNVYNRIKYDIAGSVDTFEDGVGSRTSFSEYKQEHRRRSKIIFPDSNTMLGLQPIMHLNFKPKVEVPSLRKTRFENARQLRNEGDGRYRLSVFDDFQRLIVIEKGGKEGTESIIEYEWGHAPNAPLGLCLRASLPYIRGTEPEWINYEYDALGRLISFDKLSHGGKKSIIYHGNTTTALNSRGGWKELSIDPIGKLRKVTVGDSQDGNITETNYQYNHRGCLKTATLPRDEGTQKHSFTYDNAGRLITGNRAESGYEEHTYNADGMLASRIDAKGQRTAYYYDSKKRLSSIKRFDADNQVRPEQCVTYYYDVNPFEAVFSKNSEDHITAAQWGDENILPGLITEMYSYTRFGKISAKRVHINRNGKTVNIDLTYSYSKECRISEISYTDGPTLVYSYDSMGRQSTLTSGSDILVKDAKYSHAGQLKSFQQLIPGTNEYITEAREINSQCQTHKILAEQAGNFLVDVEYEYCNQDGRLVADKDCISGEQMSFAYDSMGRLKSAKSEHRNWEADYEYDGFGSLTAKKQKKSRGRLFEVKHDPRTNHIQQNNQLEYDANGNIINHFGLKLSYDIENHLVEVRHSVIGAEKYAYNKDNLRIWKQYPDGTEEFYLYGSDDKMLATYRLTESESGEINFLLIDSNIYFANRLMRSRNEALVLDRIGSVKTGSSRNTNRMMKYAPFGEEDTITNENRIKFGTYVRDGMSGLDYAKRRYYSPELGRFINPDPYIGSIRLDNPDTWNRYAYCENDPINNIDPNGTYCANGFKSQCEEYNCPAYTDVYEYGGLAGGHPYWPGCNMEWGPYQQSIFYEYVNQAASIIANNYGCYMYLASTGYDPVDVLYSTQYVANPSFFASYPWGAMATMSTGMDPIVYINTNNPFILNPSIVFTIIHELAHNLEFIPWDGHDPTGGLSNANQQSIIQICG